MGMFFSRKKKAADAAARAEWMYPLKDHPALRIEHSSEPHKQSIRILSEEGALAFAAVFSEDRQVTDLTVGGPDMLESNPTYLGVNGLRALGAVLGRHEGLARLKLTDHKITYEGGIALAEGLALSTSLRSLVLWKSRIDDVVAFEIVSRVAAIPTLEKINLGENVLTTPGKQRIEQWVLYSPRPSLQVSMF